MIRTTNLSQGSVSVPGVDSRQLSARELRRIGYVSENAGYAGAAAGLAISGLSAVVSSGLRSLAVAASVRNRAA
jgi:hypothetical protein